MKRSSTPPQSLAGRADTSLTLDELPSQVLLTDYSVLTPIPEAWDEYENMQLCVETLFLAILYAKLSPIERRKFREAPGHDSCLIDAGIAEKWRCLLIDLAYEYGAKVYMAPVVVRTLHRWFTTPSGLRNLEKLSEQVVLSAGVTQRRKGRRWKGKITEHHQILKAMIGPAVSALRNATESRWPCADDRRDNRRFSTDAEAIIAFVAETVQSREEYRFLRPHLSNLLEYLRVPAVAEQFRAKSDGIHERITDARFMDSWFAWAEQRGREATRHALSSPESRR